MLLVGSWGGGGGPDPYDGDGGPDPYDGGGGSDPNGDSFIVLSSKLPLRKVIRSSCLPPRCSELHRIATQPVANQRRAPFRSGGVEIIALVP